jgi:ABC-2 type transport system permease protein
MAGKAVPGILVAVGQGCIVALAARFVFHLPFAGSLSLLMAGMVCYGLALAGIGLFISSFCSTQQQAFLGSSPSPSRR